MEQIDSKKVANNMLDYLIDPTRIPVTRRLYFRAEENLKNDFFEDAKRDAQIAYGDQKHNSDMYPQRNRKLKQREVSKMAADRKTIIASFDVLAQSFDEKDPMAHDLRVMARVISKMSEEEFTSRVQMAEVLSSDEAMMLKAASEEGVIVEARKQSAFFKFMIEEFRPAYLKKHPGASVAEIGKAAGKAWKEKKKKKEASDWSKDASKAVCAAILKDVKGIEAPVQEQQEEHEKSETPAEEAKEHGEEPKAEPKKEEGKDTDAGQNDPKFFYQKKAPEKTVEAPKESVKEPPAVKEAPCKEEIESAKKKEEVKPEEAEKKEEKKEVDTSVLKTASVRQSVNGIEIESTFLSMDDVGELSAEEKSNLAKLY